jgi:hypothetical protein
MQMKYGILKSREVKKIYYQQDCITRNAKGFPLGQGKETWIHRKNEDHWK